MCNRKEFELCMYSNIVAYDFQCVLLTVKTIGKKCTI